MKQSLIVLTILFSCMLLYSKHLLNFNDADEASGLIKGRTNAELLYTHNDSGGEAKIFIIDSFGTKKGELILENIKNRDWEEIAISRENNKNYLYVGDIGDNKAQYSHYTFYKFEEPVFHPQKTVVKITNIQTIKYIYDDGARDAEAFFIDPITKDIIIISKREPEVGVYKIKYPLSYDSLNVAEKICTIPGTWITAADINSDGSMILVKNYMNIWLYTRKNNEDLKLSFSRQAKMLDYEIEPQGEAVCWDSDSKGYYTLSEKSEDQPQYLYFYELTE
ncbi:MAG: hypothetical protein KA886_10180 [Candidatus Cloacimonetes bacterium]|nr:hypothetical protein [Candidatus Cloacimonadota bacterium]